jgi:multidrug efflux pump subunit AcrB
MTKLSLRNPIAVLMVSLALIIFASVIVPRMSVDTFPELTPPVLVVGTMAPGLGPKDVEKTITWRIEKYVSATPGVDHVQSVSRNDLSVVYVWLKWGTDLNSAQVLVQQQVAFAMAAVPKSLGVLPPFVLQYDPSNAPVIQIAVSGESFTGPQLYDYAQNVIEPVIEGIPGVASASPNGGRQRQINVIVDPVSAQARGLTSADVVAAVSQTNALLPSGKFLTEGFDANVYTNAVPDRVKLIGDAVVKLKNGKPVLLRDLARVEDGGAPETQAVAVDGQQAVYLNVLRVPGGNTIAIVDAVKQAILDMQKTLPAGMKARAIFDQSTFVRQSYDGLRKEVFQALLLVALVILLFLQNVRAVLVALIAIPIAFATILSGPVRDGTDPKRVYPGRSDLGDGAAGRYLGGGPGIGTQKTSRGPRRSRVRSAWHKCCCAARACGHADHDRGAVAGAAAVWSGQEAVLSAGADRRGGNAGGIFHQHDHYSGGVPVSAG